MEGSVLPISKKSHLNSNTVNQTEKKHYVHPFAKTKTPKTNTAQPSLCKVESPLKFTFCIFKCL